MPTSDIFIFVAASEAKDHRCTIVIKNSDAHNDLIDDLKPYYCNKIHRTPSFSRDYSQIHISIKNVNVADTVYKLLTQHGMKASEDRKKCLISVGNGEYPEGLAEIGQPI